MRKIRVALLGLSISLALGFSQTPTPVPPTPSTLLPLDLLIDILNEASGDLALQNEIFLTGVNRNRPAEEYANVYFECEFILRKLKEYGIDQAELIDLPSRSSTTWDAEMAELWMVSPELRKIADLDEVAASLCPGSSSGDITAELVYVGPGNKESYYQGKDVQGKIVLVNGPPEMARRLAVEKFGAAGLIGYSSSHPEFDPDQVGWSSIRVAENEKPTLAFMVSTRQGQELRDALEKERKIIVRAVSKTQKIPAKEQMVSALLPGKELAGEELVFTAHLFEGFAKQGANDNASGCVAILETARVLKQLMDQGKIPPLRRSVRFLFVPEISGSAAFIREAPIVAQRFFAVINEDMVGEGLVKNRAYFNLETTPHSLPSYLNDVLHSLIEWVGETQKISPEVRGDVPEIISPNGSRDPFYYAISRFSGGSDHIVFLDGGVRIPAVLLIVWPDMWYHTSGDTPDKSDSTQLKRVAFISTAAAIFLANAGPTETLRMLTETSRRGLVRISDEKQRAEAMLLMAEPASLATAYKEALNIVGQVFAREKESLASIRFFIKGDPALERHLQAKLAGLERFSRFAQAELEEIYTACCARAKVKALKPALSQEELRLSQLVPVRTAKMRGYFNNWEFLAKRREFAKDFPLSELGRMEFEARNFIDGRRSILDIRNALAAEYGPVPLASVENFIRLLERTGFVEIQTRKK
ncbi:MAG: M28 family peptidase [Candidatus Aminicenantales bacterium]